MRRYKRFLADIRLPDGQEITVHCPNTGSMRNCGQPGDRVWVSLDYKPGRKLPGTWELVEIGSGQVACIHSARANRVVAQALQQGLITTLAGYPEVRAEVRLPEGSSRFDFLLSGGGRAECVVEVKSVTLALGEGVGAFPDAVSARGQKHLRELSACPLRSHLFTRNEFCRTMSGNLLDLLVRSASARARACVFVRQPAGSSRAQSRRP